MEKRYPHHLLNRQVLKWPPVVVLRGLVQPLQGVLLSGSPISSCALFSWTCVPSPPWRTVRCSGRFSVLSSGEGVFMISSAGPVWRAAAYPGSVHITLVGFFNSPPSETALRPKLHISKSTSWKWGIWSSSFTSGLFHSSESRGCSKATWLPPAICTVAASMARLMSFFCLSLSLRSSSGQSL